MGAVSEAKKSNIWEGIRNSEVEGGIRVQMNK